MTARQDALAAGANLYIGRPCKLGHTERYTKSKRCAVCFRSNGREAYRTNPEANKKRHREWYNQNKDSRLPEYRENSRKYYRNNPEGYKLRSLERHSYVRQASLGGMHASSTLEVYKHCPVGHVVDHVVPLQGDVVCGLHVPWNLQYLTKFDNGSKGNKFDGCNILQGSLGQGVPDWRNGTS